MTSRERIQAVVRHELPDKLPADFTPRPEVMAILKEHFGVESDDEVREKLGAVSYFWTGPPVR